MMRFSKNLMLVLGSVAGIAFVALMVYNVVQINQLHAVAIANRRAGFANPRNWVMIAAGWSSSWVFQSRSPVFLSTAKTMPPMTPVPIA